MSSLRAIEFVTERYAPVPVVETEAYTGRPTPSAPPWALAVEEAIRIIARVGFSPTPTIVLVSGLAIAASFHAR